MRIPEEVTHILQKLTGAGFEAFIVGGSVRDFLLGNQPKDWDITTSARPEQIQEIFPDSFYENTFGTVGIKTDSPDPALEVVEVTTYRTETTYSDKRHPDNVLFTDSLETDLARRDFTMNAIAMASDGTLRDPFGGRADIEAKLIRAVGKADDRFNEDALRMMRGVRLAAALNFSIEEETLRAIHANKHLIRYIAKERIGDEMLKLFASDYAHQGIELMRQTELLGEILPEVAAGIGVGQNKHHIYDVYEHNLFSLKWADEQKYPVRVKIAALLHDVAKPQAKRGEGPSSTFYGHEVASARTAAKICSRLCFPKKLGDEVALLVRSHMFYYDIGEVTEKSVRRLVAKVGPERMDDLVKLRICDRMGSGVPKPEPYRLRHFQFMVEKVQKDPITVGMLKVNGADIMEGLGISPGPRVGHILAALFEEVLDDPQKNTKEYLLKRAEELNSMGEEELIRMRKEAQEREREVNEEEAGRIKKKYYVE